MKKITLNIEKTVTSNLKNSKFVRKEGLMVDTKEEGIRRMPFVNLPKEFDSFMCENLQVFNCGDIILNNDNKKLLVAVIIADY